MNAEIKQGKKISSHAEEVWKWTTTAGKKRLIKRAEMIIAPLRRLRSPEVLEVGCGTGALTGYFPSQWKVTASDISGELLELAMQKNYNAKTTFVRCDSMAMPFKKDSFDAVVGNSAMHHFSLKDFLPEAFRVLRSGGYISFAEPNMLNPQIMITKNFPPLKRLVNELPHESAYIRWRLALLLKQHKFHNIEITPFDFLHPAIPRNLVPQMEKMSAIMEKTPVLKEIAGSLHIYGEKLL